MSDFKLVDGERLWIRENHTPAAYPYLSHDLNVDAVVIGGGISGSVCAYALTENGASVALFEAQTIANASTSASTSLLQYEVDQGLVELIKLLGKENAEKAFSLNQWALERLRAMIGLNAAQVDFSLKPCITYVNDKSKTQSLRKEYEARKRMGLDVCWLDGVNALDLNFPITGGILSRQGTAQMDPYKLTHHLIIAAVKRGLTAFEHTPIVLTESVKQGVVLKTAQGHTVSAKLAVVCTGYLTTDIPNGILNLSRTFSIATESLTNPTGLPQGALLKEHKRKNFIYMRAHNNRFIIGGLDEPISTQNCMWATLKGKETAVNNKYEQLLELLKGFLPKDAPQLKIAYGFNGMHGDTRDGLPYLGFQRDKPHVYYCIGCGSNPTLTSVLGSQLVSLHFNGCDIPSWAELYKFGR